MVLLFEKLHLGLLGQRQGIREMILIKSIWTKFKKILKIKLKQIFEMVVTVDLQGNSHILYIRSNPHFWYFYKDCNILIILLLNFSYLLHRKKRAALDFQQEMDSCEPGQCTLIQCKVGPMAKDDVLTFKIRSRLFTETQIRVRMKNESTSSYLLDLHFIHFDD